MAHYTINLPGDITCDVRQGKVLNKRAGLIKRWPWIKISSEEKIGYIVTLPAAETYGGTLLHLVKTADGAWPQPGGHELDLAIKKEKRWEPVEESHITLAIKKAIDDHENKQ